MRARSIHIFSRTRRSIERELWAGGERGEDYSPRFSLDEKEIDPQGRLIRYDPEQVRIFCGAGPGHWSGALSPLFFCPLFVGQRHSGTRGQ